MLPVSGAMQLKARAPIGLRPMISHSGAYSRFEALAILVVGHEEIPQPLGLGSFADFGDDRRLPMLVAGGGDLLLGDFSAR